MPKQEPKHSSEYTMNDWRNFVIYILLFACLIIFVAKEFNVCLSLIIVVFIVTAIFQKPKIATRVLNSSWVEFQSKPISTMLAAVLLYSSVYALAFNETPFEVPVKSPAHLAALDLQPEHSASSHLVEYAAKFCNNLASTYSVGELRIYKNENYHDFYCEPKKGWELLFISEQACFYVAQKPDDYIAPGKCETFIFEAQTAVDACDMTWKFESKYTDNVRLDLYAATSTADYCQ